MRWKAQLVVLGLNGRIRRTPGYAGGYLFQRTANKPYTVLSCPQLSVNSVYQTDIVVDFYKVFFVWIMFTQFENYFA